MKFDRRLTVMYPLISLMVISGCTEGEKGLAAPKDSTVGMPSVTSGQTEPSRSEASSSIEPCDLITEKDLTDVGEFDTKYKESEGARSCHWERRIDEGADPLGFTLSVRDAQGIESVNDIGSGISETSVNQRPAVMTHDPRSGDCMLSLRIGASSRIDVTVLGGSGMEDACEASEVIAGVFEPRLPEAP